MIDKLGFRFVNNIHKTEIDEKRLGIYNPFHGHHFAIVPKKYFAADFNLNMLSDDAFQSLVNENFLVEKSFNEIGYFNSHFKNLDNEIHLMYLLVSQGCNLRCEYCFENPKNWQDELMSFDIAVKAIDLFFKESKPERKIIFYGGEPLLNKEVLTKAISLIREYDRKLNCTTVININSNGTLITSEIADFFKENNVNVAVSIDGPKEIHDKARLYSKSTVGSFEKAKRGIYILKESGIKPDISCTVGKHNYKELKSIALYFATEIEPNSVGFNFLISQDDKSNNFACNIKEATENVINAFEVLRDNGIYEDRIMRRLETFVNDTYYLKECAGYGNQFVVRADGKIGTCHAFAGSGSYYSNSVKDENPSLNEKDFEIWKNRLAVNNPDCINCSRIMLCGGGCAYNAHIKKGDISEIDEQICQQTEILLDWIIKEQVKKLELNEASI
jgi:uncharacterized protein